MEFKTCNNCGHSYCKYYGITCTRYPSWMSIDEPDSHWCGEWKEKEEQEADN